MTPGRGWFVALEGGEGSGKSTQARLLAEALGAVATREPGGTPLGRRVREIVLGDGLTSLTPRAEALLVMADRAQHVEEVVRPALSAGRHVVTDRFSGSTLAYQGYGRGLDVVDLGRLSGWAAGGLEPDVVVLLDVDPALAAKRAGRPTDRMEAEDQDFHRRVVDGYRSLAAADPARWRVVDGTGTVEAVSALVRQAVDGVVGPGLGAGT